MAPWGTGGKRPIAVVDLTGDDDLRSSQSQSPKVPRSLDSQGFSSQGVSSQGFSSQGLSSQGLSQGFSQSQRDTWVDHHDVEEDADDVIILSQDGDNGAAESLELFGQEQLQARKWRRHSVC